jgi:hypothetical protein
MSAYYAGKYGEFVGEKMSSKVIDFNNKKYLVITEIDGHVLYEEILRPSIWNSLSEMFSDTIFIYPELSDTSLYKKCGFELPNLKKSVFVKNCALKLSPFYAPQNSDKLFKCFYFQGTAFIKSISEIDEKWASFLLDSYAIGDLKRKSVVMIIDNIQTYTPYIHMGHLPIWIPLIE